MTYSAPLILQRRGRPQKGVRVNGKNFSGSGTFYDVEVGSGSCGDYDSSADLVVAVNKAQMANGPNPNNNPTCQKTVYITGNMGSTSARVVDTCPSCAKGALDMSPKVFELVCGNLAIGVCTINWNFT
ncbi:hypothetical protein BD770DRAFT_406889 [Pilaira anomala]|nr:hypothetical protein BD770DRAFT_406889 [Pilaira anomala]